MNILLLYLDGDEDSLDLAEAYEQLHDGDGILVQPVYRHNVSDGWEIATHDNIQASELYHYEFPLVMNHPDLVVLSMGFPIGVYGQASNDPGLSALMYHCQGQCSFEHYISMLVYQNAMVFRLDGMEDGADMIRWLDVATDIDRRNSDNNIVFDCDSGLGKDYDEEDAAFADAFVFMQSHGFPVLLDATPHPAILQPGATYDGWFGWYDTIPANYFANGCWHGAVGWQTRSTTFKKRDNDWCCSMIKAGFLGTIGACYEPGIFAFPRAREFCQQFYIDGKSFGEAAWNTARDRMRLCFIGDPLAHYLGWYDEIPHPQPMPNPVPPVSPSPILDGLPKTVIKYELANGKTLTITEE